MNRRTTSAVRWIGYGGVTPLSLTFSPATTDEPTEWLVRLGAYTYYTCPNPTHGIIIPELSIRDKDYKTQQGG